MSTTGRPAGNGIKISRQGDFGLSGALQSLPDLTPLLRYAKPSDDSYSLAARPRLVLASTGWGRFV